MDGQNVSSEHTIVNRLGFHGRPAALFVQMSSRFSSSISVECPGDGREANGKSILSMLSLAATQGTLLRISARGADAAEAVRALGQLIDRGFDEE